MTQHVATVSAAGGAMHPIRPTPAQLTASWWNPLTGPAGGIFGNSGSTLGGVGNLLGLPKHAFIRAGGFLAGGVLISLALVGFGKEFGVDVPGVAKSVAGAAGKVAAIA